MAALCLHPIASCRTQQPSRSRSRVAARVAVSPRRSPRLPPLAAASSSMSPPAADLASLESQLEALMSGGASMTPEEVEECVAAAEAAGAALGVNTVSAPLNDGSFSAAALAGRLKKVTGAGAALTMAGLTFGSVQPAELELAFRPLPAGVSPIYKGPLDGIQAGYSVTSAFAVPGHDLAGINVVSGSYRRDDQLAQRLHVTFDKVTVTPDLPEAGPERQAALERWVALFGGANGAALDPATGRIVAQVANPASVWLDFLAMTPSWQLSRSSLGSIALLRRAA